MRTIRSAFFIWPACADLFRRAAAHHRTIAHRARRALVRAFARTDGLRMPISIALGLSVSAARTGSTGAFSTVEIAAFQIFKPTARAPRPLAKYNLPIAVSSVIDLLTGLIRPRAFNFALE
jgi:hypothetical protein